MLLRTCRLTADKKSNIIQLHFLSFSVSDTSLIAFPP